MIDPNLSIRSPQRGTMTACPFASARAVKAGFGAPLAPRKPQAPLRRTVLTGALSGTSRPL